MAFRTWGRLLLTALGVSVLAGAGQLGVAYGFGIIRLTGAFTGTTVNQWPAQLVWVGWFAANAAVAGAVLTGRLARRDGLAATVGRQLAIGGAAALGATAVAPLCMQPARAAELISVDPVWAVGICAILGAVLGAGAAIAVLLRPELGWNVAAVAGALWLLALLSVLPSLGTTGPLRTVRLGVLEPSWLDAAAAQRLALLLLPTVALLAGAATAGLARRRGEVPLVSGATGVAGPVLVAFAYLTAGPGGPVDRYQTTPYYAALLAIAAGALGATAAALLRWPAGARTATSDTIEPTDILRALPTGPALPSTASPGSAIPTDERENDEPVAATSGAELAGSGGPRTVDGSGTIRTVPAHWDWPATTAAGQHGLVPHPDQPRHPETPAPGEGPAAPATWLTVPTGEFVARPETLPAAGHREDKPPTSAAADPAVTPARTAQPAPTATAGTEPTPAPVDRPDDQTRAVTTDTAAPDQAPTDTPDTTGTDQAAEGGPADAERARSGDPDRPGAAVKATTGTRRPSGGDAASAPAPKPRRTRKPKSSPAAATAPEPTVDTSSSDIGTGPASSGGPDDTGGPRTGTPGSTTKASARAGVRASTPPVPSDASTAAADSTARAVAPASTTGPTPSGPSTAAAPDSTAPAGDRPSTGEPASAAVAAAGTTASSDPAAAPATGTVSAPAGKTARAGKDGRASRSLRGTEAAATTPINAAPEPPAAMESADEGDGAADTAARTGTASGTRAPGAEPSGADAGAPGPLFGLTTPSDREVGRWTPAPPTWPVTPAWASTTSAQVPDPTASDAPSGPEQPTEPTPRPRHRAPLPDLSRAASWDAFATARRGSTGSPGPRDDSTATAWTSSDAPASTGTRTSDQTTEAPSAPTADARPSPAVPDQAGTPTDTAPGRDGAATGDADRDRDSSSDGAEQPSRRGRLGLFRRNRSRDVEESRSEPAAAEPLPAQDEEYVDWVAGLGKPLADNEPEQESGRRSLRSTGRHHRD
ncbi:hypothetical protein ACFOW4_09745 [Micromonospora sp. GCM10011542]|uniref:hypothetical protein n=1 Tax=Micromonospora sp. GCM10011542 TaxID=3317337 RepID=UPI00361C8F44